LELPPVLAPTAPRTGSGIRLIVAGFRFRGNTVFSAETLSTVTSPWLGQPIGSEDLEDIAEAVTRFYVDAGYISSGAFVPDQDSDDGTMLVQVIEGRVSQINVTGTRWFRDGYVRRRLSLSETTPVNIFALEQKLQLLQQDPQIRRIDARLTPAIRRGESALSVDVEEASPLEVAIRYSNHQSPSVGANGGEILLSQRNLLGIGDLLTAIGWLTSGFRSHEFAYAVPLSSRDTELRLGYRGSRSEVIEDPFDILDLESELTTYRIALKHPVYWTPRARLSLGTAFEYRRSKTTFLDGRAFFEAPGADENGNVKILVLRFSSDWVWRTRRQVVAVRAVASVGLDRLDGSDDLIEDGPDGEFFAFLGQAQWVYQLSDRYLDTQVVVRSDVQLASDWLVSMERLSVGGSHSVRGYRENTLVRDNGWVSSLELRIPLKLGLPGSSVLELAPFFDVGMSWNHNREPPRRTLASAGVGLRYAWGHYLRAEVYWGRKLSGIEQSAPGLQGHGLHVQITGSLP
jgi:hemolysin activation/secretion protein